MKYCQRRVSFIAMIPILVLMSAPALADPINVIPYGTISPNVVDFEDVLGVFFPGTLYDEILTSGQCTFAERFVGQNLTYNGDLDVLSGTPANPLTLQVGAAGENLSVGHDLDTNELIPSGRLGFGNANGYGEGSFAVIFPGAVSAFGLRLVYGAGNTTYLHCFRNDGSVIALMTVTGVGLFGFSREGDVKDISGVSVYTNDDGGLGYDDLVFGEYVDVAVAGSTWGQVKNLYR